MRLLNVHNHQLKSVKRNETPPYAILSHTWGDEEVSFKDIQSRPASKPGSARRANGITNNNHPDIDHTHSRRIQFYRAHKSGWEKIIGACEQAKKDNLDYIWIDTCCIDKSSSSELSEAINSMFQWYKDAVVCYAVLDDIDPLSRDVDLFSVGDLFGQAQFTALIPQKLHQARWFTRGWTLQELIAPKNVIFFTSDWRRIGDKLQLQDMISAQTGIDVDILREPDLLSTRSVAHRMAWASARETTRLEDMAYCLLGIFGVNMPLLYGEGANAFIRLQEELMKDSEDESIFAWDWFSGYRRRTSQLMGILAPGPEYFKTSADVLSYNSVLEPYAITNRGLRIQIPILKTPNKYEFVAVLHCRHENNLDGSIGIPLRADRSISGRFFRDVSRPLTTIGISQANKAEIRTVFIHKVGKRISTPRPSLHCHLRHYPSAHGVAFCDAISIPAKVHKPSHHGRSVLRPDKECANPWNMKERTMLVEHNEMGHYAALKFSISADPSILEWREVEQTTCIFLAVLELPTYSSGKVGLLAVEETEGADLPYQLYNTIQDAYQTATDAVATLQTKHGLVRARVEKTILLGEEMFVLDIEREPNETSN